MVVRPGGSAPALQKEGHTMAYKGIIKKKRLLVKEPIDLPDGTEVEVEVRPAAPPDGLGQATHPILTLVGLAADSPEWDQIVEEIYKNRRRGPNRRTPSL